MTEYVERVERLPFPSVAQTERATAFMGALASIPEEVRGLVAGFRGSHLRLLWAAQRGGEYYMQLLRDHPALALLLALRRRFGIDSLVSLHDLLQRKRHVVPCC